MRKIIRRTIAFALAFKDGVVVVVLLLASVLRGPPRQRGDNDRLGGTRVGDERTPLARSAPRW